MGEVRVAIAAPSRDRRPSAGASLLPSSLRRVVWSPQLRDAGRQREVQRLCDAAWPYSRQFSAEGGASPPSAYLPRGREGDQLQIRRHAQLMIRRFHDSAVAHHQPLIHRHATSAEWTSILRCEALCERVRKRFESARRARWLTRTASPVVSSLREALRRNARRLPRASAVT